jgi:hypothetical protein
MVSPEPQASTAPAPKIRIGTAASAQAQGECRTDCPEQGQCRGTQRQRGGEDADGTGFKLVHQAQQRGDHHYRQPGAEPVGKNFRHHPEDRRLGREQQLFEHATLEILREQPWQSQQAGEQGSHPDHPGSNHAQAGCVSTNAERKQAGNHHEKAQCHEQITAAAPGNQQVAM